MTGAEEQRVTYPMFFEGRRKELLFTYRTGPSLLMRLILA